MKTLRHIFILLASAALFSACQDDHSYQHLLTLENQYSNNFLADQRVEMEIPADTVFETGPDAPYYRLDEDGYLYMQVLNPGTKDNMVKDNDQIFFRYTRWALASYRDGKLPVGGGNNLSLATYWFRYNNYQMQGSYQWGVGVQYPLRFLPIDCEVNILIKSQMGFIDEQNDVQPFLYRLTYSKNAN